MLDETLSRLAILTAANETKIRIGLVTDNVHPGGDYRVKVKLVDSQSEESKQIELDWCRIATFGAGPGGRGAFVLPEVGDEVLVAFINGDINQPIIIGTLWNGKDEPAYSNKDAKSKTDRYSSNDEKFRGPVKANGNDIRSFSSRAKHELIFNDNANGPRVTLQSGKKHRIVLDDKDNEPTQIEICDGKDENYILIDTRNKKITIESKTGDIVLKAKETVRIEANEIEMKSKQQTSCEAQNYKVEAKSKIEIKANGQINIEASGPLIEKGKPINLN